MRYLRSFRPLPLCVLPLTALIAAAGCQSVPVPHHGKAQQPPAAFTVQTQVPKCNNIPRELSKVVLPTYRIEPPDILLIDAIHVVPHKSYQLRTSDQLYIQARGAFDDSPIDGVYAIEMGGEVQLGPPYGVVQVSRMDVGQAKEAIQNRLREHLQEWEATVSLAAASATQPIAGEHMVGPDGTVTLGIYGSIPVVGLTIAEARFAIESHLSRFLEDPVVSVDVYAYNSKVYYIVTQGAGLGDGVFSFPVTGRETVLDAISQINGLNQISSTKIWIARPTGQPGKVQILPVSWESITAHAATDTNYQILPGDRVFVAEDKLVAFDTGLAKILSPLERIAGFSILGASTVTRFSGNVLRGGGNPSGRR